MKLCADCYWAEIRMDAAGKPHVFCGKTLKVTKNDDPNDFVFGGGRATTIVLAQKTRENPEACGVDAKWFNERHLSQPIIYFMV